MNNPTSSDIDPTSRRVKRALIVLGIACGLVLAPPVASFAADMPVVKARPMAAPAPAAFNWSAIYVGAHGCYGTADIGGVELKGGCGGMQGGFQAQSGIFVLGAEIDAAFAAIDFADNIAGVAFGSELSRIATLRGRAGLAFDRLLIYGTGGFARGKGELWFDAGAGRMSESHSHSGAVFGGGIEIGILDNWSLRAEYLNINLKSEDYFGVPSGDARTQLYRVGVNYLFR